MVGAAFSPTYFRARSRGRAEPERFGAVNLSLRGAPSAWVMTERAVVARSRGALVLGTSSLRREGDALVASIDERQAAAGGRVRGTVRVTGLADRSLPLALDATGRHRWWPVAPRGRVRVELDHPRVAFDGEGYADCNEGDAPLERDLRRWCWSHTRERVLFDVVPREGTPRVLSSGASGPLLPSFTLPSSRWGIARTIRSARRPRVLRTLVDAPFYARALVEVVEGGGPLLAVHEVLSLDRLRAGWVRFLLPFRTRREP